MNRAITATFAAVAMAATLLVSGPAQAEDPEPCTPEACGPPPCGKTTCGSTPLPPQPAECQNVIPLEQQVAILGRALRQESRQVERLEATVAEKNRIIKRLRAQLAAP